MKKIINWLRWLIEHDWGKFHVCHGLHTIFVPTIIKPKKVWVSLEGRGTSGCGFETTNTIGWETSKEGITFFINVKTDSCIVRWSATSYYWI